MCSTTSSTLVVMNAAARIAVTLVSRFAVDRPVMNPDIPPPPMPRAPPSLFCKSTTPTREMATKMWMASSRMIISKNTNRPNVSGYRRYLVSAHSFASIAAPALPH